MSYLAGLTKEKDGGFTDRESVYHPDAESALGSVLGFCNCGMPTEALRFIWKVLELIGEETEGTWEEWYKGHRERADKLFHKDHGIKYVVYYLLAEKGLTEHGGSVPGWLDGLGKDILDDLRGMYEQR